MLCMVMGTLSFIKACVLLELMVLKFYLKNSPDIREEFGQKRKSNDHPEVKGALAIAQASVMYDVLNHIAIDSILSHDRSYEVDLAIEHLKHSSANDLLLYDRNYPSYFHLANRSNLKKKFVIRCSSASRKPSA